MTTQQPTTRHGAKAWTIGGFIKPVVSDGFIFCPLYRFDLLKRRAKMTLKQYNKILHNINSQIETLQQSRTALIEQNQEHIKKQIENRQETDRTWFVKNFDVFWNNRHKFAKNTPNADIIIDFFNLYTRGNKVGRKFVDYITISDLIALWDLGYKYKGYPIVEYTNLTFSHKLTYIKNEKLVTITGIDEESLGFSPLLYAILEYLCEHKKNTYDFEEYKTIKEMKNILAN